LTGQVEEANHRVMQALDRIEKLSGDLEFRLSALEQGGIPVGGGAPAAAGTDMSATSGTMSAAGDTATASASLDTTGAAGAGTAAVGTQVDAAGAPTQLGQQPGVLGQLPSSAVQGGTVPQLGTGLNTPEAEYQQAFALLQQAKYPEAETALRQFLQRYPEGPLAGNAQYWLGETFYVRGDYRGAAVAFAEGYQRFPNSSKAPDNLLKLGMSLAQLGQKQEACGALTELNNRFPTLPQPVADRAARARQSAGC
jgi:tol-pal system protein YbgF